MDSRPFSGALTSRGGMPSLPSRGAIPGTASRLASSSNQNSRTSMSQGKMSYLSVTERPMSQQGLVTPKTAGRMSQRQVQDKSYYMGLMRAKTSELRNEIVWMTNNMESLSREQAMFLTYEKRAESLAGELKELQGELADYNLLFDKLNTDTEIDEVKEEYQEIMNINMNEAESVDHMFGQRNILESQLKQLEQEMEHERHVTDNLIAEMKPELRQKFNELKEINLKQTLELDKYQKKLDDLNARKILLEEELSGSRVKQEAVSLIEKLRELIEKRDTLVDEEKKKGTPAQERERLLLQMKDNNAELVSIDSQTSETKELIIRAKDDLSQLEQDLEDQQGERTSKYRELKKREETMDTFLTNFEENKSSEEMRRKQLEGIIVQALEKISRNLAHFQNLPSPQELALLKDDLNFKEGEMEKSRSTVGSLGQEQRKLNLDLEKIEQLDSKIQQEMEGLRTKNQTMENEILVFGDLVKLKQAAETKKAILLEQQALLDERNNVAKERYLKKETEYQERLKALNNNDTYVQLTALEKRWSVLEQRNFALKESIAVNLAETDYAPIKIKVKEKMTNYNKLLMSATKKS